MSGSEFVQSRPDRPIITPAFVLSSELLILTEQPILTDVDDYERARLVTLVRAKEYPPKPVVSRYPDFAVVVERNKRRPILRRAADWLPLAHSPASAGALEGEALERVLRSARMKART